MRQTHDKLLAQAQPAIVHVFKRMAEVSLQ